LQKKTFRLKKDDQMRSGTIESCQQLKQAAEKRDLYCKRACSHNWTVSCIWVVRSNPVLQNAFMHHFNLLAMSWAAFTIYLLLIIKQVGKITYLCTDVMIKNIYFRETNWRNNCQIWLKLLLFKLNKIVMTMGLKKKTFLLKIGKNRI
jgi:hypothetical protein